MSTQFAPIPVAETAALQPLYPSGLLTKPEVNQVENPPPAHWCGRCVTTCVQTAVDRVCFAFNSVIKSVTAASDETYMLNSIFRKLDRQILAMIEQFRQVPPDYFQRFSTAIRSLTCVLDFMHIPVDLGYYVSKSYKKNTLMEICGKTFLTASDIAYSFLWLQELGINKLSNVFMSISNCRVFSFVPAAIESVPVLRSMPRVQHAAASIGNLRIFSFTIKITLNSFAQSTRGLTYLFFTTQSFINFIHATKAGKADRIIGVAVEGLHYASELALESLLFFGYSSVTGLGIIALASIALSVAHLSYASFKATNDLKVRV